MIAGTVKCVLGQRADSAMVADHRSVLPRVPGIPWWGAVILAATASAVGFAYDAGTGDKTLSAVFSVCYVAGCVLAVLAVRQSGLFSAVIQPPLILFFAVPTAYFVFHGSKVTGIKDTLINCGYPLIERFPLMFFTSAVVLLVGMGRWFLAMSSRRAASHDAETPDAATAAADNGLDSAATPAAAEKTPTRRGRRHSIERPRGGATAAEEEAPQRPARKARTAAGSERASRSRHARPPDTEIIEPVTSRPRRPRSGGPPVEPEPRRRTRASQPREREPRDPRDPRAPRERRNPPPIEPDQRYDRPQRHERSEQHERGERPERRRRASEYDPSEPRPANGVNRNNGSHESGSHHPVSRVRYRAADDGESRTENRTRAPRNRNPDADSWQYDV
ncbi:MAG: hypothetical protein QOI25_4674 [Mycobacterium sp.]|nr:hypothetical protein [Mycobacterium sp.]